MDSDSHENDNIERIGCILLQFVIFKPVAKNHQVVEQKDFRCVVQELQKLRFPRAKRIEGQQVALEPERAEELEEELDPDGTLHIADDQGKQNSAQHEKRRVEYNRALFQIQARVECAVFFIKIWFLEFFTIAAEENADENGHDSNNHDENPDHTVIVLYELFANRLFFLFFILIFLHQ